MERDRDIYSQGFRRARLEAAARLARPEMANPEAAAREIGISRSMLDQIEMGKKRPSFETLESMARAYNVLPGDLLPSLAPKGPEVDRILGPLMTLPQTARSMFIVQMESLARTLAMSIREAVEESHREASAKFTMRSAISDGSNPPSEEHRVSSTASAVHLTRVLQGEVDAPFDEANEDATTRSAGPGAAQASRTANRKR